MSDSKSVDARESASRLPIPLGIHLLMNGVIPVVSVYRGHMGSTDGIVADVIWALPREKAPTARLYDEAKIFMSVWIRFLYTHKCFAHRFLCIFNLTFSRFPLRTRQ